jgi:ribonuclease HI
MEVPNAIIIYMDRFGINGQIGMATYSSTLHKINKCHLGTEKEFNVYAAKLKAIHMAIKTVQDTIHQFNQCTIFSDSQAAIISIFNLYRQLGPWQYLIKNILNEADHIRETCPQYCLNIEWVSGHKGIGGNEKADEAAKDAAMRRIGMRDGMKGIKAAWNQSMKDRMWKAWQKGMEWRNTECPLAATTEYVPQTKHRPGGYDIQIHLSEKTSHDTHITSNWALPTQQISSLFSAYTRVRIMNVEKHTKQLPTSSSIVNFSKDKGTFYEGNQEGKECAWKNC